MLTSQIPGSNTRVLLGMLRSFDIREDKMITLKGPTARKRVVRMLNKALANWGEFEKAKSAGRLPKEKLLANLTETDFDAKMAEAASNANDANEVAACIDPELFKKLENGLNWAKQAEQLGSNGYVQVGSIVAVKDIDGDQFMLLIIPEDSNPLSCGIIGQLEGLPVQVVSDSCALGKALMGAPVTDHWEKEVNVHEGKRRADKFFFQGSVLAIV